MLLRTARSRPRWLVTLWALSAVLHLQLAASTISAAGNEAPAIPVAPAAAAAAGVSPAPRGPATPSTNATGPVENAAAPPQTPAIVDDQRMIDLARRMAESKPGPPKAPQQPVVPDEKPLPIETTDEARAAKANRQALVHPNDQRPLGPKASVSTEKTNAPGVGAGSSSSLISLLGALALVIGIIFALRGTLRRFLGGAVAASQSPVVQVLTRVAVAPRNHVLLMRVGNRVLVVSDSAAGMRTLAQIDQPEEVADLLTAVASSKSTSAAGGFRQMLAHFNGSYAKAPAEIEGADDQEFRIDRARDQVSGLLGKIRNITKKGGDA